MSKNSEALDKLQKQLDQIAKKFRELGKPNENPFNNFTADKLLQDFKDVDKAAKALDGTLFVVNDRLDALNNSTDNLVRQMEAVLDEIKKSETPLKRMNKAFKGLVGVAQDLADESERSTSFNARDLAKLKDKITLQSKAARDQAESLLREIHLKNQEYKLGDKTKKLTDQDIKNKTAALGILKDLDGTQQALVDKLDRRVKLEEKYLKKIGFGGQLASGLDKALQKAGLPALGIADAMEKAKKNFIDTNGESNVLKDTSKELMGNLKNAASFANLAQLAFVALFKAMKEVDKASGEFAKNQGISYKDTLALRGEMNKVAKASGDILVTSQALMETQASLNSFFGTSVKFTGEMASDFAQLTKRTKMTAETQGLMALEMGKTGKTAMQLTKELNTQTFELNNQKGVQMSVKQIQDAIGKTAASLQLTFKGSTKELANQVTSARALGTTLQGVEQISKSLLDFESSIQAELEAELLLGKDINLERARAAALQGDLATVAEEVMENQSIMEAFNTKNVIAQEKAAAALGMSREDLANMVLEQQKLETVRAFGAENMNQAQKKYNDLRAQGLTAEQAAAQVGDESLANQLQSASVAERFEGIMLRIQEVFIGFAEPILGIVDGILTMTSGAENLANILIGIAGLYGAIRAYQIVSAALDRRKIQNEKKVLALKTGQAAASSVINPVAAVAGIVVAGLAAAAIYSSMNDGIIESDPAGFGKRKFLDKGSITSFNDADNVKVVAGTNAQEMAPGGGGEFVKTLISEVRNLISVNTKILDKDTNAYFDGDNVSNKVTNRQVKNGRKLQ